MQQRWASFNFLTFLAFFSIMFGFSARSAIAQESSSKPESASTAVVAASTGPSAALRDVLSAACKHDEKEFVRFLTSRNRDPFLRMAPAARISLMKRFVLLDQAGKPTASVNPSGRPTVACETPDGTAEIQIGGADTSENLAFLPVELRDPTDVVGNSVMHIQMGLVLEAGDWKILSIGLVLLDLPSLEVEWDAAEIDINEKEAVESLRKIAEAAEIYRRTYSRLPESLANLGPPLHSPATVDSAALLEPDLAGGMKSGYSFRYVILGASSAGIAAKFELAAMPITYGRTGQRSFFRDAEGKIHAADHKGFIGSASDPRVD